MSSKRIYIRHADKEYANGASNLFKHDPGVTEHGMERCLKIGKKLIETWGEPTKIVSSPFRRARETARLLNSLLKNPLPEIFTDVTLSEYLGNHKNVALDVTGPTKIHHPPHPETFEEMIKRVEKHNHRARRRANELESGIIWYVTHGLIIKQLAHMIGIKLNKQFPCLTCFSIAEDSDMIKGEVLLFPDDRKKVKKSREWVRA